MDGIFENPDPEFFDTVTGFDSIESWAESVGMTLNDALDAGVCADDGNDNIYVPKAILRLREEGIDPASMTAEEVGRAYGATPQGDYAVVLGYVGDSRRMTSDIDNAVACGATTRDLCPDCIDAYKNGIEPGESACETGDHAPPSTDHLPDIRNAKAWLMGISSSLKAIDADPSTRYPAGTIGLGDMAATIDDIVARAVITPLLDKS